MSRVIGIDLGTTNSGVAVIENVLQKLLRIQKAHVLHQVLLHTLMMKF